MMRETGLSSKAEGLRSCRWRESPLSARGRRKRSGGVASDLENHRKGPGRPLWAPGGCRNQVDIRSLSNLSSGRQAYDFIHSRLEREDGPPEADDLRALQAPLNDRDCAEPAAAKVTLRARGALDDSAIVCKVEIGRAVAVAAPHPATGGTGLELCSGDMLLEALVACAGVTLKAVATVIGAPIRSGRVSAEADIDAPPERLATLLKLTERYCVVLQTLKRPPSIEAKLRREGA
jgi:uncharacterized OsmC-like protein